MKRNAFLLFCLLASISLATAVQARGQTSPVPVSGWDVTYTIVGPTTTTVTRRLLFMSFSDGTGTFRMISPRTVWTRTIFPSVWNRITPEFMTFSGEVEFPIGNVGRETGTLIFKGNSGQNGQISGAVVFVVNRPGTASSVPYEIRTGTFIAIPIPIVAAK